MDVIFEDNHLFVVNKPAGLLTQPSGTKAESLEEQAKKWLKEKYHKPGNVFLEAVHRLDKPVSGIVVFAKTSKALSRINASMRDKALKKIYYALVEGSPSKNEEVLEHYLTHDEFQAKVTNAKTPGAKLARLTYRVLRRDEGKSLLEVQLDTGRYHQIRAQLSAISHPIIGDTKYGSKLPITIAPDVIALHHKYLEMPHPVTQKLMVFEAKNPDYLF